MTSDRGGQNFFHSSGRGGQKFFTSCAHTFCLGDGGRGVHKNFSSKYSQSSLLHNVGVTTVESQNDHVWDNDLDYIFNHCNKDNWPKSNLQWFTLLKVQYRTTKSCCVKSGSRISHDGDLDPKVSLRFLLIFVHFCPDFVHLWPFFALIHSKCGPSMLFSFTGSQAIRQVATLACLLASRSVISQYYWKRYSLVSPHPDLNCQQVLQMAAILEHACRFKIKIKKKINYLKCW